MLLAPFLTTLPPPTPTLPAQKKKKKKKKFFYARFGFFVKIHLLENSKLEL